ncbi:MAG: DUF885 family protein, partial [Gemmatimonadota bacterium]
MSAQQSFDAWMDAFFASYYMRRPVNATFVGVHEYDHRLPDLSENGAGDTLADMETLLQGSRDLDPAVLEPVEQVDLRLARGFLRIQLRELESRHFLQGNPSLYTGEAIFGVMSLFLSDFAPLEARVESAVQRLEAVPALLAQGRDRIREAPMVWTQRAHRECTGALAFLEGGIDALGADKSALAPQLHRAAEKAAAAFADHAAWLATDLASHPRDDVACGADMLSLYLREGHFLEADAGQFASYARARMADSQAYLEAHAGDFGAERPGQVLEGLRGLHATADGYTARYREIWDEIRGLAEERELLTWPDFPIRYVPQPAWARQAAPSLYFLPYRAPAAFHRPPVHDYLIPPLEPDLPAEEQAAFLADHNDSVIKLNHVVHHGGIGHHVQNGYAYRSPSRVGRMAAVDCASRIAMFCGGTMAEGWACYATDLVREHGGLTPQEAYAEVHARVRMCVRAVVDVELHEGRMSLDDAQRFYQTGAGMSPQAARSEAVKNSMFPGTAL